MWLYDLEFLGPWRWGGLTWGGEGCEGGGGGVVAVGGGGGGGGGGLWQWGGGLPQEGSGISH